MKPDHEKLEHLIHNTLRALPDRKAPRTLEHRVLAAIATRKALPWYRQSFAHWPVAARAGFVGLATALAVSVTLLGTPAANQELNQAGSRLHSFVTPFSSVASTLHSLGSEFFARIPTLWLYGGALALVGAYVALFGIGAAAYRTLFSNR